MTAWRRLLAFGLSTALIALALTGVVSPWVDLSPWKIFRRCASIGAAISLWWLVRRQGRSLRSYGLADLRAGWPQLRLGALLGLATLVVMFAAALATGVCRIEVTPDQEKLWRTVLGFLPAAALIGVLEELIFRGFILQQLLPHSRITAILVSSGLYAAVHLRESLLELGTWRELFGLFLFGVVLAISYLRTGQLYLAIGLHSVLAYGARVNKLLIDFNYPQMAWLFGTTRLVNGLVNWGLLLALGGAILWRTRGAKPGRAQG